MSVHKQLLEYAIGARHLFAGIGVAGHATLRGVLAGSANGAGVGSAKAMPANATMLARRVSFMMAGG